MSVATEFAPSVTIPARARVEAPVRLASVTVLRPHARPESMPLRLTRRGVLVLTAAVLLLGLGVAWLASLSAPPAAAPPPAAPHAVTVEAGDTLWSIASRVAPGQDPRAEVARLQQRNHLADVNLVPGQELRVP
jgi:Tfp pilus assembly protein FimV